MTMFFSKKEFDVALRRCPMHMDIIYHSGNLSRDRLEDKEVDRVAKAAWSAMEKGDCRLFQRRISPASFDYIATKVNEPAVRWEGSYSPDNRKLFP